MKGKRISRKSRAFFLAVSVMSTVLATAVPALAAPAASARLVAGTQVIPGAGQSFQIQVNNTAPPVVGEAINHIRILLPAASAGLTNGTAAISGPGTWTTTRTSSGTLQAIIFKDGTIAPGANQTFTFPVDVAAPSGGDRSGAFQVQVSSTGPAGGTSVTIPSGGTLTTVVKILEVTSVAATNPAGVTDGNGTAGQAITVATTIKNHAATALSVDPALAASGTGANEVITDVGPTSISGLGGTATFEFPVTLGTTGANDRTTNFTASGVAGSSSAVQKSTSMVVQVLPTLAPDIETLSPRNVRPTAGTPLEYTFTINAEKSGTPNLSVTGGTLTFAGNTATLTGTPVAFGPDGETKTLSFGPIPIAGADGAHDAVISLTGTDANDKPYSQSFTLDDAIKIDSIVPTITAAISLPNDGDGDAQTAAKNGDTITVSGSVADDTSAVIDFVELRSNAGDVITVPVTRTGNNYTGSAPVNFAAGATSFLAAAQATDPAGNIGAVESTPSPVDLVAPKILNPGDVLTTTTIQVQFDDAVGLVKGGCNPTEWDVDGNLVIDVRFSDGTTCRRAPNAPLPAGTDNYRILVLAQAIAEDAEPAVTYTPGQARIGDRAKDGAGNFTILTLIDTVSKIAPAAPDILAVERNGGTETATEDGGKYWTRFGGSDLTVDFAGVRNGYRIQVLDGADTVLFTSEQLAGTTGTVAVPIGSTDGDYVRKLRLLNARGVPGATTSLTVALDTLAPAILAAASIPTGVTVTFSEIISAGTNFSFDWYAYEMVDGQREYYLVDRVTGSGNTRTLDATHPGHGPFGGVDYVFTSGDSGGARYVDRAGNLLGDTAGF